MNKLKIGTNVKIIGENRVFVLSGFTYGRKVIPDGWYIDEDGFCVNPKFCEEYNGATSVLPERNEKWNLSITDDDVH